MKWSTYFHFQENDENEIRRNRFEYKIQFNLFLSQGSWTSECDFCD